MAQKKKYIKTQLNKSYHTFYGMKEKSIKKQFNKKYHTKNDIKNKQK